MVNIPWLDREGVDFPPTTQALQEPNGLLAAGADLSPARLLNAYRLGIFPWYSDHQPILWWSPNPRLVLYPELIHISKSLHKLLRKKEFKVTADRAFEPVLSACAAPRREVNRDIDDSGTWITSAMAEAYTRLHQLGYAHSIEVWQNKKLAGGLYGISLGKVFFGESMFSAVDNASKVALVYLCGQLQQWGFKLIDCQVESDHLISLGAINIARDQFEQYLQECTNIDAVNIEDSANNKAPQGKWQLTWRYPDSG